ncbi:MAG: hypothetical protein ACKOAT_03040 [Actinomycetota bacterium]
MNSYDELRRTLRGPLGRAAAEALADTIAEVEARHRRGLRDAIITASVCLFVGLSAVMLAIATRVG